MSNAFMQATARAIDRHGSLATYRVITEGAYDIETDSVVNAETDYSVKMYMKQIKASQFNYPNMIGRESGLFYLLALNLGFTPSPADLIIFGGKTYKVDSVQSHSANAQIVLYRVLAAI